MNKLRRWQILFNDNSDLEVDLLGGNYFPLHSGKEHRAFNKLMEANER